MISLARHNAAVDPLMPSDAQAQLRGSANYLHKLVAASHIYNLWTDKGADAGALAERYLDGSVDKLDQYMNHSATPHHTAGCSMLSNTEPSQHLTQSPDSAGLQSVIPAFCTDAAAACAALKKQVVATEPRAAETQQEHISVMSGSDQTQNSSPKDARRGVPLLHKDDLSYEQFVGQFMQPNLPVMIQDLASKWRSSMDWVTADGHVNIDFLAEHYGQAQVMVSNTTRSNATCAPRLDMTVVEFAHWWKMHKAGQDDRLLYLKDWHFAHAFPNYKAYETPLYFQDDWLNDFYDMEQAGTQQSDQVNLQQQPCTTAADLCSTAVAPTSVESNSTAAGLECRSVGRDDGDCSMAAGAISGIPYLRRSHGAHDMSTNFPPQGAVIKQDTDNKREAVGSHDEEAGGHGSRAACETLSSDYRFVYLGCKGTWTPLHADVLRSYSWSTNVVGRKRWKLLPPDYTHLLYDRFGREMAATFDIGQSEGRDRFPNLDEACQHVIECIQEAGETIFVPSGWHHTVHNLEDTLSINHNWLNGYNLHWAWALLQQEHRDATVCIEDCREGCSAEEFEALVQRNMAANCGMDYAFMADFTNAILFREEHALRHSMKLTEFDAHAKHRFKIAKSTQLLVELRQRMSSLSCNAPGKWPPCS